MLCSFKEFTHCVFFYMLRNEWQSSWYHFKYSLFEIKLDLQISLCLLMFVQCSDNAILSMSVQSKYSMYMCLFLQSFVPLNILYMHKDSCILTFSGSPIQESIDRWAKWNEELNQVFIFVWGFCLFFFVFSHLSSLRLLEKIISLISYGREIWSKTELGFNPCSPLTKYEVLSQLVYLLTHFSTAEGG